MSAQLFVLERWLPGWVRRRMFGELVHLTADAFATNPPRLARLSAPEAIGRFAAFTRNEVERVLATGSATASEAVRERLFDRAREMGRSARRRLGIVTAADAFRALRLLYRGIGIDMDADCRTRQITVRRCAFSDTYTPAVCAFISALDAGFVSGITGSATLVFSERITEGAPCCTAQIRGAESP
jgi:hypothetical protein